MPKERVCIHFWHALESNSVHGACSNRQVQKNHEQLKKDYRQKTRNESVVKRVCIQWSNSKQFENGIQIGNASHKGHWYSPKEATDQPKRRRNLARKCLCQNGHECVLPNDTVGKRSREYIDIIDFSTNFTLNGRLLDTEARKCDECRRRRFSFMNRLVLFVVWQRTFLGVCIIRLGEQTDLVPIRLLNRKGISMVTG